MEDVGLSGLALQGSSSNCLVLMPQRQLGNCLLSTAESYGPTDKYSQDFIQVSVGHFPIKHLLTESQYSMLQRILVLTCSSDIGGKIVSS